MFWKRPQHMLHIHYICSSALEYCIATTRSISRSLLLKLLKFPKLLPYCNFLHIHIDNNRGLHEAFQLLNLVTFRTICLTGITQRNMYCTFPYELTRNELLMPMWSKTRGNSITNLHDQKHFLMKHTDTSPRPTNYHHTEMKNYYIILIILYQQTELITIVNHKFNKLIKF